MCWIESEILKKDFLSLKDLSLKEIEEIFTLTEKIKKNPKRFYSSLKGKFLGLIFEKPSLRTRVSFEIGIRQLGGDSLYLGDIGLDRRENIRDVAKTLSRYLDGVILRTFSHNKIIEFAKFSKIPVINGLSDLLHPCQVISDLYTIREKFGHLKGVNLGFIGDGNNVCHSLLYGCSKTGVNLSIATPKGYPPNSEILKEAKSLAKSSKILLCNDPKSALKDAEIIYTDVWASMGEESEREERKRIFKDFQVNRDLVSLAKKNCLIMHCLPAHRGEEITDEIIDSGNSIVFDQAENRLYVQKAILIMLLKGGKS